MKNRKRMYRFFTIADYKEEEDFLRKEHLQGYKLIKMIPPCLFIFEKCQKADYVYRLDFPNVKSHDKESYLQLYQDCGWEYLGNCLNWSYFRKPVSEDDDLSIFSDNASRLDMVKRIYKTRMLPITTIFLCCIIPQLYRLIDESMTISDYIFLTLFMILFFIYIYLIIYCGLKLKRIKGDYTNE